MPVRGGVAPYVGIPDARVRIRKQPQQYIGPTNNQFDFNISDFVTQYDTIGLVNDNVFTHRDLGAAMVQPKFTNRNNFVEGLTGDPVPVDQEGPPDPNEPETSRRLQVAVPKGAPAETEQEINKRVWEPKPTVNQQGEFKKEDQEFVPPGGVPFAPETLEKSPQWVDEFHFSTENTDPKAFAPPVSWVHQQNNSPNTEWFIQQVNGNFTNEMFWIDINKHQAQAPSDVADESEDEDNRFNRYGTSRPLLNYFAIRIGAEVEGDDQRPGSRCLDIVFPIDSFPFIYDHGGQSAKAGTEEEPEPNGPYKFQGYIASIKNDTAWIIRNDTEKIRLKFFIVRGKLVIQLETNTSPSNKPWYFPSEITTAPNQATLRRYNNFFVPASKIAIMGRGFSFLYNFNPLEFDIYDEETGFERGFQPGGPGQPQHAVMEFPPLPTRTRYPNGVISAGYVDMETPESINASEDAIYDYTIIDLNKATLGPTGQNLGIFAHGFDHVMDKYEGLPASLEYTSQMIPVNPSDKTDVATLVSSKFRDPLPNEDRIRKSGGALTGFDEEFQSRLSENKILKVIMNCKAPLVGPNTEGISKRFASPILWRLKGHQTVPVPDEEEWIDITDYVNKISYTTSAPDFTSVEQNFTVDVLVPKKYQYSGEQGAGVTYVAEGPPYLDYSTTSFGTRQAFIDQLNSVNEIEISLGYYGDDRYVDLATSDLEPFGGIFEAISADGGSAVKSNRTLIKVFTGLTEDRPAQSTFGKDMISLRCVEKTHMLKNTYIFNSPAFDGMTYSKFFLELAKYSGFPQSLFDPFRSEAAQRSVLPQGFTFQEPEVRFEENTNFYDAFKQVLQIQQFVIRTDPDGTIALTDLYQSSSDPNSGVLDVIDDIPTTHPDFIFYENPNDQPEEPQSTSAGATMYKSPFKTAMESLAFDMNVGDRLNQIALQYMERTDGSIAFSSDYIDLDSIENPESPQFIGYRKLGLQMEPGFGEESYARAFLRRFAAHAFQNPLKVNFKTFGRPTLRPLDIITFVHQDEQTIRIPTRGEDLPFVSTKEINYRVQSVSGTIDISRPNQWMMEVEAIHM